MKKLLILAILGLLLACKQSNRSTPKLTQLLPDDTAFFLKINNLATFNSDLKNNTLTAQLLASSSSKLSAMISNLETINTSNAVIAAFVNNEFSLLTKYHDSLLSQHLDSLHLYHHIIDSIAVISPNKDVLEQFQLNNFDRFSAVELANPNSSFSLFLNLEKSVITGNSLFNNSVTNFSDWMLMDFQVSPDQVSFGAISSSNDSIFKFVNIFENTIPQENRLAEITPIDNRGMLSFTYDDFSSLRNNLSALNQSAIDTTYTFDLLETFSEVGKVTLKTNEEVLITHSIDAINTNELLHSNENKVDSYRNIDIYQFENSSYFKFVFKPIMATEVVSFYAHIDNFFIFAETQESLKAIIANFQNGTVLSNNQNYRELKKSLSDESSLFVLGNASRVQSIFHTLFGENIPLNKLSRFQFSGFQLVQDDGFVHINGSVAKSKTNAQRNSITEEFSVSLDADLLNDPKFVINHRTKQKEIVVQDVNNNLYLISNKGKVLWKKQLNGPVLGSVAQVDLYKNGRLQLAFATPRRVYILDRNGKDVAPFPLKFNNSITQPLAVFDYDNNKNYRFVVAQNNVLIMYDRNGRRVSGFKYQNTNEDIITQPKHFRVNGRDYIVFATTNQMKILNRRGQSRVAVNEGVNFSGNDIYYHNNLFTTTSSNGELVQINLKGLVSKQSLNLVNDHVIDATSKTLTAISENKLTIKQRTQELDFGNYTKPKIFYLNDKIYVAITDLQSQKILLFDSQSRSISNFPVFGNSIIDLANIDGDSNLEFVTKGESNSIILYQKN